MDNDTIAMASELIRDLSDLRPFPRETRVEALLDPAERDLIVAALKAYAVRASTGAPDGWKLVPIKPTPRMDKAGVAAARAELVPKNGPPPGYVQIGAAWDAMLAAAPPAPCSPVNACPRPVNSALEGKTAAQCIADGECGCDASPVSDGDGK